MLGPDLVARRVVVDASEVGEVVERVGVRDSELVREFPCGRSPDACTSV